MKFRIALALIGCVSLSACVTSDPNHTIAYQSPPRSLYRPLRRVPPHHTTQAFAPRRPTLPPVDAWPPASGHIDQRWRTIVIHHSATERGSAATFDRFHRSKGWDELGYHFVIGNGSETPDGLIEVGPRWNKQKHGAHCKTPNQYFNEHGIGICLVGDFTKHPPTARQMASLARLVKYLQYACHIPTSAITTHGLVNPKTKCPGSKFSLGALRARLAGPASASSMR